MIEGPNGGIDTVKSSVSFKLSADVEKLVLGSASGISGTGKKSNNQLTGNAGNNWLDGGKGNDTVEGGQRQRQPVRPGGQRSAVEAMARI